ncbi:hypothetical protein CWO07_26010 [Vibrio splendidus]|uniref:Uncharacterized protein n=1 Tax=Vibrio splendidus TaxID=29497 RepID=A0A2T5E9J3_VIBSP|nr:hypothetical protein A148_04225 [Vibrio splendidus 1F-157]PMI66964.1 hypothetical protein BCU63_21060 [Vibrio splendidus]PMJ44440.1 hypothetical protein BCU23_26235 [Vibrio splendidus]PTP16009.1 hypothetical protein CWO07_26010 [Vibrio splendidus]PTP52153.1 hypothetical protein CWO23_26415 [Vibrio splendidus]
MLLKKVFKTLPEDEKKEQIISCLYLLSQKERDEVLSSLKITTEYNELLSRNEIEFIFQVLCSQGKTTPKT